MRKLSFLLLTIFILNIFNIQANAQTSLEDCKNHWAKDYIQHFIDKGVINGYPDGTFKPDNNITRGEFIVLTLKSLGYEKEKAQGYWAQNFIDHAAKLNIISKMNDKCYTEPKGQITREEMARVIYNASVLNELAANNNLSDEIQKVIKDYDKVGLEFRDAVIGCYEKGIISGNPDGTFKPKNNASRAESCVIIFNLLNKSSRKPFESKLEYIEIEGVKHYLPEDKKEFKTVYNIIEKMTNKDTSVGYMPTPYYNEYEKLFSINIVKNKSEYEKADMYEEVAMTYQGYGLFLNNELPYYIQGSRKPDTYKYYKDTIETVFKYLFEEEWQFNIDKFKALYNHESKEYGTEKYISNGRQVKAKNAINGFHFEIGFKKSDTNTMKIAEEDFDFMIDNDRIKDFIISKAPLIIDVRGKACFDAGHLSNAINIPISELSSTDIGKYKENTILVYCNSGVTSHKAYKMLKEKGFNVYNMYEGYENYSEVK